MIPSHSTFKLINCSLLHRNQACRWFLVLVKSWMWGLTVNQNQKKYYIRKQLRKDTSTIYKKTMHFYNSPRNFGTGPLARGCTYQQKFVHTRLSLSPPLEERVRGEVGGSWTPVRSNHPTDGESKSVITGGSLIEASGWSTQSCMACGNPNTNQRTRMIKI